MDFVWMRSGLLRRYARCLVRCLAADVEASITSTIHREMTSTRSQESSHKCLYHRLHAQAAQAFPPGPPGPTTFFPLLA